MNEPFVPTNQLERLLMAAASDPAGRPAFYRALADHELYVINAGNTFKGEGAGITTEDNHFDVQAIEIEGKFYIPIFTSSERISLVVRKETPYIAINALALLEALKGNNLALNPGSSYGKFFFKEEIASILDGSVFGTPEVRGVGGRDMRLGEPAEYPRELTKAIARYFASVPEVKAAYLALATWPNSDDPPSFLIGIQMRGEDGMTKIEDLGLILNEFNPQYAVDVMEMSDESDSFPSNYLARHVKPFYRKKVFGIF